MLDVLVIDDERTFRFPAIYARTADAGAARLAEREWLEVWLDYSLGRGLTIAPVLAMLVAAAAEGHPFAIGVICVHTSDPARGHAMVVELAPWYRVQRVVAHPYLAAS